MAQVGQVSEQWQRLLKGSTLTDSAEQVLMRSQFVSQWGERFEEQAQSLIDSGDIEIRYEETGYQQRLAFFLLEVSDETQLHQQIRRFRQREMTRVIWRKRRIC